MYEPFEIVKCEKCGKVIAIEKGLKKISVTISRPILAVICIIFGVLVIAFPDLLQWIVGLFFIIEGLLFFADYFELRKG